MCAKMGEQAAAREKLEEALAIFRRLRAKPYVQRSELMLATLEKP
ncbi:MAG: hypothetical protein ACRDFS_10820 [Chloroflexota bacterium]